MNGIKRNKNLNNEIRAVRHTYDIFSKLEHNGAFTFDLLHRSYLPGGDQKMKFMIKEGVIASAAALRLVSHLWLEEGSLLREKLYSQLRNIEGV